MKNFEWLLKLSTKRWGFEDKEPQTNDYIRSDFHKDYDRIIFSSPFRRLQNKTQVFPLPGSVFVHNRLTHSLEVASVGRSLGNAIANKIISNYPALAQDSKYSILRELGTLVSVSCLAHDLGNPPFGHSGEHAISNFFSKHAAEFKYLVSENEWQDLIHFEGNANTFRLLTHNFNREKNSFSLTYSSILCTIKYPCLAVNGFKNDTIHHKKFGIFNGEKNNFEKIVHETKLLSSETEGVYYRHPLVFLTEAADDICYSVIDLEDAHRIGIISFEEFESLLFPILELANPEKISRYKSVIHGMIDNNERASFIRSLVINELIKTCIEIFWENLEQISTGNHKKSLFDSMIEDWLLKLNRINEFSINKIYNNKASIKIELAGYKVLGALLEEFVPAVLNSHDPYNKKLIRLLPIQFKPNEKMSNYEKIFCALDFISGMTDLYALDLYCNIKGISIPSI